MYIDLEVFFFLLGRTDYKFTLKDYLDLGVGVRKELNNSTRTQYPKQFTTKVNVVESHKLPNLSTHTPSGDLLEVGVISPELYKGVK